MKHTGIHERDPRDALSLGIRAFPAGSHEPLHVHDDEGQLKWPRSHAMVSTPAGIYVLPPQWALWIPAGESHGGIYPEASHEHNVHVFTAACGELPEKSCAVRISDSLERAVLSAMTERRVGGIERAARDRALLEVLRGEVKSLRVSPVPVVWPVSPQLRLVADALLEEPSSTRSLTDWATLLKLSTSTLNRTFQRETGSTFGEWRKRARLLRALARLAAGRDVASVAEELGYRPSSFIHMFRQTLGVTPGQYYR